MKRQCICRRRKCARHRQRWEYFCSDCWSRIPPRLRALITRASKEKRITARDQLRAHAEQHLDGTRPWSSAPVEPCRTEAAE
ncbi:hypothetical protein [Stakelama tenebrarum]|uniref:Uncharacterized protein n=1 Tax=Stakelama tenebrarum TaxID=2711215 RepID=A0A6G6Y578_9SPHN|nr:hypothetical protein [Sphingosinithalassobacter tenebrarum]QIG79957.1 hypothetical protein G5C33_09340 [Sphingosinithalassobacter tenebrarum]